MTLTTLLDSLQTLGKGKQGREKSFAAALHHISAYLCLLFKVRESEVALFMRQANGMVRFVLPKSLATAENCFPLVRSTVTKSVFLNGQPILSNKASRISRLSIYEYIAGSKQKAMPIQKFIALPVSLEDKTMAVLWISRRGGSRQDVGKDFTGQDVENTCHLMAIIAPHLHKLTPAHFIII